MSQFIESIYINKGLARHIDLHQQRVDQTFAHHGISKHAIQLLTIIKDLFIPKEGLFKLRIVYDSTSNFTTELLPYHYKKIQSFKLVEIGERNYTFKYADRDWIYTLLNEAGTDDIVMLQNGMIKDSSYANIIFQEGDTWYTPSVPLLAGTMRCHLIDQGLIQPASIYLNDLSRFSHFKLINAMMGFDEATTYSIETLGM